MAWYRPYDTVLFCPPTPHSVLAKSLKKVLEVEGEKGRGDVGESFQGVKSMRGAAPQGARESGGCTPPSGRSGGQHPSG